MDPREVLNRQFSIRMIAVIVLFIISGALISAGFFYYYADRELGETYSQKIETLSLYRSEIIRQSLFIFLGFASVAVVGVAVFGTLYTHKIVGPLVRIRGIARELAAGNFDVRVKFREGDAIHPLAESLDNFAKVYGRKYEEINRGIHELHRNSTQLRDLIAKGDHEGAAVMRERIVEKARELNDILSGIKV